MSAFNVEEFVREYEKEILQRLSSHDSLRPHPNLSLHSDKPLSQDLPKPDSMTGKATDLIPAN